MPPAPPLPTFGWREWVALPGLGVPAIKAKLDTGARTSVIHAHRIERDARGRLRFCVRPARHDETEVWCEADLIEDRWITDSGGHREFRPVIRTDVTLAGHTWAIEVSLTARDSMMFRMLLGRTALAGHGIVDPAGSYLMGRRRRRRALP